MTTANTLRNPGVKDCTIMLRSGNYFDFANPDPKTIIPSDIAHALAYTCRFGGHCKQFYSVAQHSILVSAILPYELKFAGLMHDAAEAYCGDIVAPLKQLLPDFKAIEKRVEAAVCKRFAINNMDHPEIKKADYRLLRTEQRDLTSTPDDDWNGLDKFKPLDLTISPLGPFDAERLFMYEFVKLWNGELA